MWIIYAIVSAFFAGITAVLAKIGIKETDSNVVTALRTCIITVFSWLLVFMTGAFRGLEHVSGITFIFLILSGMSTGGAWICYFKALQLGSVNKVVPIDKSSTILTIIFAIVILREPVSTNLVVGVIAIGIGTLLMIQKKKEDHKEKGKVEKGGWMFYAILAAVFSSLTAILGKIGIQNIESNLGTAIRTVVVLIMSWLMVFITKKQGEIRKVTKKSWIFIILSGLTTGGSWLFYYKALQEGKASVVVPIDKLSILITMFFSVVVLKEKMTKRGLVGLVLLTIGTFFLIYA